MLVITGAFFILVEDPSFPLETTHGVKKSPIGSDPTLDRSTSVKPLVVGSPTHLKNMILKMGIFPPG